MKAGRRQARDVNERWEPHHHQGDLPGWFKAIRHVPCARIQRAHRVICAIRRWLRSEKSLYHRYQLCAGADEHSPKSKIDL